MPRGRRYIRPTEGLWAWLAEEKPVLAFEGSTREEWERWRPRFLDRIRTLLGETPPAVPLEPEVLERHEEAEYVREKVIFDSEPYASVPCWVLVPKDRKPGERRPALLCAHGHGRGKDDVVGLAPDEATYQHRVTPLNYDYARQFARRGYVTIAPDWRCFGERAVEEEWARHGRDPCNVTYLAFGYLGYHLLALQILDGRRTLDYLLSREEVDPERVGCVGLSFGGTMTTYLSALDDRIRAAVISGYVSTVRGDALSMRGKGNTCGSQYMPGLLRNGDIADVAGLIAPKPLLVEIGEQDDCFIKEDALAAYRAVERVYRAAGVPEKIDVDVFPGGHAFSGRKAFDWFDRWLGAR
jgi:dienelactone hydrolase